MITQNDLATLRNQLQTEKANHEETKKLLSRVYEDYRKLEKDFKVLKDRVYFIPATMIVVTAYILKTLGVI
jgi:hypothetical protein